MVYLRRAKPLWIPLVLVLAGATLLFLAGYSRVAILLANLGPAVVFLLVIAYIVLFDPRHKWPTRNRRERATLLMTYGRADPPR